MNNVKAIQKLNETELRLGLDSKTSWHDEYKDSAYIFVGGLDYALTEGDILTIFSQYGEIVNINLVRDKKTGKPKGYCFLGYENQRSTVLAVDNFNGIKLCGHTLRVDHVKQYRRPKDEQGNEIVEKGCAPKTPTPSPTPSPSPSPEPAPALLKKKHKDKDRKKKKKKHKKRKTKSPTPGESDSDGGYVQSSSGHPERRNQKDVRPYDGKSTGEEEERESYNPRQKRKGEREAEGKRSRDYLGSSKRQPDRDRREQDSPVRGYTERERYRSRSPVTRRRSSSSFSRSPSPERQRLKLKQRGRSESPGDKRHSHTVQDERRWLKRGDEAKRKYSDQYGKDGGKEWERERERRHFRPRSRSPNKRDWH